MKTGLMKRMGWCFWALAGILVMSATPVRVMASETQGNPQIAVKTAADQAMSALRKLSPQELKNPVVDYKIIKKYVLPMVDVQAASRLVMGHYWKQATPDQRNAFMHDFTITLIRTYGKALSEFPGSKIRYLTNRDSQQGVFATVYTEVIRPSHSPITVIYHLWKTKQGWRIYDVSVSGLSLVMSFRSSYSSEIQQSGISGLLKKMKANNQQFENEIGSS